MVLSDTPQPAASLEPALPGYIQYSLGPTIDYTVNTGNFKSAGRIRETCRWETRK